jgi:tetratricopeptide (TPR) repeat protein
MRAYLTGPKPRHRASWSSGIPDNPLNPIPLPPFQDSYNRFRALPPPGILPASRRCTISRKPRKRKVVEGLDVQAVLAQGGLVDGSPAVEVLRERLQSEFRTPGQFRNFSQEASRGNTPVHRSLLQDTVNSFGKFLGFKVEFGNYGPNTRRPIEFDGFWQSKTGNAFLLYLETQQRPKLTVPEILHTLKRLNTPRQAAAGIRIFALLVVCHGRFDDYLHNLPRPNMTGRFSVLSLDTLFALGDRTLTAGQSYKMMERLLLPVDPLAIDRRMELIDLLLEAGLGRQTSSGIPQKQTGSGQLIGGTIIGANPTPLEETFPLLTTVPGGNPPPGPLSALNMEGKKSMAPLGPPSQLGASVPESPISRLDQAIPSGPTSLVGGSQPPSPNSLLQARLQDPPVGPISRLGSFTSDPPPAPPAPPPSEPQPKPVGVEQFRALAEKAETEGRASEALQYWEALLLASPEDPVAREGATRARMVTGGGLPPMRPTSSPGLFKSPTEQPSAAPQAAPPASGESRDGRRLLAEGLVQEAIPLLEAESERVQNDPSLFRDLGLAKGIQGDREGSQRAFSRCLQLLGNYLPGYREVALAALHAGQTETAEDAVVTFLSNNPDNPMAYILLGEIYGELGRDRDSAEAFENAIGLGPDNAVAHCELSRALMETGNYSKAEENLTQALSLDPNLALAHAYRGDLRRLTGDPLGSRASYEKALHIDPGNILARLGTALLLEESGNQAKAAQMLEDLLQEEPGNHKLQTALLRAQARAGQTERTRELAEYILTYDPRNRSARIFLGISLYNLGDVPRATKALEGVLEEAVDDPQVLLYLGLCYFTLQRWDESIEALEEATRHDPTLVDAYLYLGYGYRNQGNGMDAAMSFTKVFNLDPENEAAREGMMSLG